jgi:putative ABC transport system permease protein
VLGVRPLIGSLFGGTDDRAPVVVLSEGLWRQRFGADPNVLGRIVHFDGAPRTVIGVVADALAYPDPRSRAWVPFRIDPPAGNRLSMFEAVAKLRPGATIEQAASEGVARGKGAVNTGMTTVAIFGGDGPIEISVRRLDDAMTGDVRRPLIVLLVAIGLLLLIAMSNVASLQLARATFRQREFAIRAALGASTGRALRQLVVEGTLLGTVGGAVGLGVAWLLLRGALAVLPADFPRVHDLAIDARAAGFAIVSSVSLGAIVGLLPALQLRKTNLVASLAQDGTTAAGVSRGSHVARQRLLIIGAQVAIVCVLLVGASLLGRTFVELLRADRGYDSSLVMTGSVSIAGPGYTPERRAAIAGEIVTRLGALPGIRHAAFTSEAPWMPGGSTSALTLPSRTAAGSTAPVQASPRLVSAGYFPALGLRIVSGRSLEESDTETSQPVVVVNDTFARRYLGDAPLDARIPLGVFGGGQEGFAVVVGVAEDVRYLGASVQSMPEMYFLYRQVKVGIRSTTVTLLVRGDTDPAPLASAIRSAVRQTDAALVPAAVMTIEDRLLSTSLARPRLYAWLLGSFAVAALAVTGVGLFGVLSYTVAQRTRELGVRAALGARQRDLLALVLRQGMSVCLAGAALGMIVSMWATRYISTLLYGVSPLDWPTYAAVPVLLLAVAFLACAAPARRAARLDPLRALRS